jgi:signal transduction histidine kinase/CheY-like chemotaxis protein
VPDEVRRLGQLFRAFVWGQLVAATIWVIVTIAIAPESVVFRISVLAAHAAVSFATLALERSGRLTAAAILLVTTIWMILALRVLATAAPSHGAWFLFAVLVGVAGLFIGLRAALATAIASAAYGLIVLALAERDLLVAIPAPGPWLDWVAGILLFSLIAILQVAAVRLYRGGLELASAASLRHRALFDSAPIALFELDLHGERPVTTDANETARRLLGRDDDAAIAAPGEVVDALVAARGRGQQLIDQELAIELAGEQRQVIVRAELPAAGDDLHNVVVSLVDVTEQRRLAERVHDARRFETVASVAGSIAHDFNNLLSAILGRVQILRRDPRKEGADRDLAVIERAALDGRETVRRIQEFSRLRRDRRFAAVDLGEVLRDVVEITRPRWQNDFDGRSQRVELEADTPQVPPVLGSGSELREVMTNLVLNALDAMPQGGSLRIACRSEGAQVVVTVADTGTGMTEDVRRQMFDPFFTTKGAKGMGLGMSVVYGILTRHGAGIDVDTAPGRGTTFTLRFDRATEALVPAGGDGAAMPQLLRPGRILVIDDEAEIAEIVRDVLASEGHEVTTALCGAHGVESVRAGSYDLVFTDLGMPDMSGWEVAERVHEISPGSAVVLVTGWGATLDEDDVRRRGVEAVVNKPFEIQELVRVTARLLARAQSC